MLNFPRKIKHTNNDSIICSLGWNCYPGWLLRDLYQQPAFPWDWMQFFDHTSLINLLTNDGIEKVVSGFSVKNIVPGLEVNEHKPHFWNESLKIRSPHDHEKSIFKDIDSSKQMISNKLNRRLERLKKSCNGVDLIFVCNYNHGCYGLEGYSFPGYLDSMREFIDLTKSGLSPNKCSAILFNRKRPDDLEVSNPNETFEIERLSDGVFYCSTIYDFEDAYFKKTSKNVDIKHVRHKYWPEVLNSSIEKIKKIVD